MKTSQLKTYWIIFASLLHTGNICLQSITRGLTGTMSRQWVDAIIQKWTDRILNLVKVRVKVVNPDDVKPVAGEPTIIMCNHSSLYDIPISIKAFPEISLRMLSKKELSKIPLMAGGMRAAEFPFIDRKNRAQAIRDLKKAEELMKSGIVLWLAPEGTRSRDGKLAPFKKGGFITAINSKAKIIPIGIRGAYDILPARTKQINTNLTAEVHVGHPIDASEYTIENKEELVKKVHGVMAELVGEK